MLIGSGGGGGGGGNQHNGVGGPGGREGGLGQMGDGFGGAGGGGGGGGAAGGAAIILDAVERVSVEGQILADGAGWAELNSGYGAGGGIAIRAPIVQISAADRLQTLGGNGNGNGTITNGGTIKIFAGTLSGQRPAEDKAGRAYITEGTTCGDGVVDTGEECDPPHDEACPGLCIPPGVPGECTCCGDCDDGDACTDDMCSIVLGMCIHIPKATWDQLHECCNALDGSEDPLVCTPAPGECLLASCTLPGNRGDVQCTPCQLGLVARWCFDDCTARDCEANHFNGTNDGAVCVEDACVGGGFEFNSIDAVHRIDGIPQTWDDTIALQQKFTVSAWVYWYGPMFGPTEHNCMIFDGRGSYDPPPDGHGWGMALFIDTSGGGGPFFGKVGVHFVPGANGDTLLHSNSLIAPNCWTHIAAVYDSPALRIYINGQLDASGQATGYVSSDLTAAIGGNRWGAGTSSDPWDVFLGKIDEVRIYDRPLTVGEIGEQANACPSSCEAIPTLSTWGAVILTLIFLAGAKIYFGRRQSARAW